MAIMYTPAAFWFIALVMAVLSVMVVPLIFRSVLHNKNIVMTWHIYVWCVGVVYYLGYFFPV